MPCYDHRDSFGRDASSLDSNDEKDIATDKRTIMLLSDKINYLEAGLCAIITELETRNLANEVIAEASRKGLVDLMGFWEEHQKDDDSRLRSELHKYSVHEQEILRDILNQTTKR